jgi:hypothetical protein
MNNLFKSKKAPASPHLQLRERIQARQTDLKAKYRREMDHLPNDDVVSHVRLKHKYRQLGLHL